MKFFPFYSLIVIRSSPFWNIDPIFLLNSVSKFSYRSNDGFFTCDLVTREDEVLSIVCLFVDAYR